MNHVYCPHCKELVHGCDTPTLPEARTKGREWTLQSECYGGFGTVTTHRIIANGPFPQGLTRVREVLDSEINLPRDTLEKVKAALDEWLTRALGNKGSQ